MKKMQQGFTLIELMIVVAIIGILAAIALPAYQDYIIRSKITEAAVDLDAAKTSISEYASTNGATALGSATIAQVGITSPPSNAKYVSALTWTSSATAPVISATLASTGNTTVDGTLLTLTGTVASDNSIAWVCTGTATKKYLPSNCRN